MTQRQFWAGAHGRAPLAPIAAGHHVGVLRRAGLFGTCRAGKVARSDGG
ncbi:hypothetical protein ABIE67_003082 [Streptomyces sp. V4I8]